MERATPPVSRPKRRRRKIDVDVWLSLPLDLLVEVFSRLDGTTDVVNCTGTCKLWRRAIIDNASSLRPRSDGFNPNLLVGFFYQCKGVFMQCIPGQFKSTLLANTGGKERNYEIPRDLVPTANSSRMDLGLYNWLLSSRDGLVLLSNSRDLVDLCLCNPMTGACTFLPDATLEADAYVLVNGNNFSPSEANDVAVGIQIIAVKRSEYNDRHMNLQYQHFSSTLTSGTGSWGPVMRSGEFKEHLIVCINRGTEVVFDGTIYWLGYSIASIVPAYSVAAMDVRSGETRTIELPKRCRIKYGFLGQVLATTSDGRLSLLGSDQEFDKRDNIQVWVHIEAAHWILQRTIHIPNRCFINDIFWPRSGCLLVDKDGGQPLLINIETGSSRPITSHATIPNYGGSHYPYETDW